MRFAMMMVLGLAFGPVAVQAQDAQTLADVRQELTVLNVEVQKLRRELSTTGGASLNLSGNSVLDRMNAIESELQRLTSKTEELENRINRVVTDGTNRIGDLEFRLVELEGGDVGAIGETSTLGGGDMPATNTAPIAPTAPSTNTAELAIGEADDFERAKAALATGDFRTAADQFATFNQTYPGGPLGPEAELRRGDALSSLGDTREAARAYLASFSSDPVGPVAPEALYQLGKSLGALEQRQEACVTFGEVATRFPTSPFVPQAANERAALNCQ
ncbi:MAG: tol-pal system protein YbgF [Sulfitobacter sp.]|nr:tol-pal system protein YbgF [Sulfitobacter sp.]